MSVIINKWNDESGDSITIESPSFKGNQSVSISSPVQQATTKRSMVFIGKCKSDPTKTVKLIIEQEASTYTYDFTLNASKLTIPAGGGNATITGSLKTYRNGTLINTETVTPTISGTAEGFSISNNVVTASNRTTTVGETRSIVITGTYNNTFDGQKVQSDIIIYQEKNQIINSNYNPHITAYGTPIISIGSGITAAGGSATVTHSVFNTETYYDYYTSGSVGSAKTRSIAGTSIISITANGNNRFSLSGNTVNHSSMGTNEVTDIVAITAKNAGDNSKTKTASASVTNNKKVQGTSGGIITYENVIAGAITNKTIPASGGYATATAGNGSQNWSKTAVITTYIYDSGSTKNETTSNATSGTNSISPSISSISASASTKGTTVSNITTVKSQEVTWTGLGNKSKTRVMQIYQVANNIESYEYSNWTIFISANPITIAASGGTSTIIRNYTRTKTAVYTSGSKGSATTESATPTLSISGNGFTLNGTTVTASKNNVGQRTAIVTASYSGATSKSVTITQNAAPNGIGYMQIEGNGIDHYTFIIS